ncbi:unnamed protein product [Pleuronectes platessa]|uniref:Uncharacterized protein n=1 Tax=Pleuronectes platessa TaxID=8262 RepID=A0A9N7YAI3_PLEPL|nr:unnamed protein product [Pleuronectes platessa]
MLDMISGTPLSAVRTVKPMETLEDGQSLPLRGYVAAEAISIMELRQRKETAQQSPEDSDFFRTKNKYVETKAARRKRRPVAEERLILECSRRHYTDSRWINCTRGNSLSNGVDAANKQRLLLCVLSLSLLSPPW